ncbi:MAG: CBS domain-containing protein [Lysobacterales bacterium]
MSTVKDLLSEKGGTVFSVTPDQPVLEALRVMSDAGIGSVLVMQGEELIGILSERDYARKVVLLGRASRDTPVTDIMSAPVVSVQPSTGIHTCMRLMTDQRIRHLAVVADGAILGVVSIGDLVKRMLADQAVEIDQLKQYISS